MFTRTLWISEVYEKSVPKLAKANGTRLISHKFTFVNIFLKNYGIFITHLESLDNTDSQALKHEIKGYAKKWYYVYCYVSRCSYTTEIIKC